MTDLSPLTIGDKVHTTDGRYGVVLEVSANWAVVAWERGGPPESVRRGDICEVEPKKTDLELT